LFWKSPLQVCFERARLQIAFERARLQAAPQMPQNDLRLYSLLKNSDFGWRSVIRGEEVALDWQIPARRGDM